MSLSIPGLIKLQRVTRQLDLHRWITLLFALAAVALGLAHTWAAATSYSMNADGISYLDIGDAYLRGDWKNAINPVWPPMYSWVLGLFLRIFQPPMRWEFPLVHLVNFLIYLLALASFIFLWRQALHYRQVKLASESAKGRISLPGWAFQAFGFLLFTWVSLTLIEIWAVTPDMLMAALVYVAAALILRMRLRVQRWHIYALFGFTLGLGYLAKTVMLPIAFLFLGMSLFSAGGLRKVLPRVMLSLFVFLLVAGPFVALISRAKGYFTYGESGKLTYVRMVNGVPYPHWQGAPPGSGTPSHPSRKIFADPSVYEFASPIGGTYPITYDPSYWYEGVQIQFNLQEEIQAILSNALVYFNVFFREQGVVLAGILILYLLAGWQRMPAIETIRSWSLAIITILALMLYSLVFVEGRYIGVFLILLWTDLLANLTLLDIQPYRKLISITSTLMIVFLLGNLVAYNLAGFGSLNARRLPNTANNAPPPSWPGEVAEELLRLGVSPGDQVGVIGYAFDSYWARLARVKIVAEMFEWEADPFYLGSPAFQARVVQSFAGTGANAIVAEHVPPYASLDEWHQVGKTNYFIYMVR